MENGMAFATHGRTELAEPHPYYDYDNEAFAFEAVRLLADRGRKRVALLGPPPDLTYHKHTAVGFERGVRRFGLTTVPLASCDSDSRLRDVRAAGNTLAADAGFPDGLVCSSSSVAVALAAGYADAGRAIGCDFDLVSKQQADLATIANPNILSIPEDFRDAGHGVADMVIRAINGENPATLQRVQSAP
jgi:LacI family transcriptional regulator